MNLLVLLTFCYGFVVCIPRDQYRETEYPEYYPKYYPEYYPEFPEYPLPPPKYPELEGN